MRLTGKTVCLLFLFILISPLYAEPFPDPQPSPQGEGSSPGDELFFFEEFFIFEDAFSFEPQTGRDDGEDSLLADPPLDEEILLSEESSLDPQSIRERDEGFPRDEESRSGGTALVSEDILSDDETLLSGEILPGEEVLLSEETLFDDETFPEDDDFFFEAPPLIFEAPVFEARSFDTVFPNFSRIQRTMAMSGEGLRNSFQKDESPMLIPNPDLEIDLLGSIMKKNPSHLIEALAVVPYNERELDLLDIYNALGRIEKIKDYPFSFNDNDYYIFTESTRIESSRNRKAISDPPPAVTLPLSETMYLRLKEVNYGNLFIRGDISISVYGITYSMTNFTDVRYFFLPIMKAERFITIIYLEPVTEGILIYSMTGFYLPGFIADKVNLTPNINRRIEIFTNWITEGLRKQESAAAEQDMHR